MYFLLKCRPCFNFWGTLVRICFVFLFCFLVCVWKKTNDRCQILIRFDVVFVFACSFNDLEKIQLESRVRLRERYCLLKNSCPRESFWLSFRKSCDTAQHFHKAWITRPLGEVLTASSGERWCRVQRVESIKYDKTEALMSTLSGRLS